MSGVHPSQHSGASGKEKHTTADTDVVTDVKTFVTVVAIDADGSVLFTALYTLLRTLVPNALHAHKARLPAAASIIFGVIPVICCLAALLFKHTAGLLSNCPQQLSGLNRHHTDGGECEDNEVSDGHHLGVGTAASREQSEGSRCT